MTPPAPPRDAPTVAPGAVAPDGPQPSPWVGWVALVLAAATPLVAFFGNLGFAPAVALAGLLCLPFAGVRVGPPWLLLGLLAAALAWALVTLSWSPFHPEPVRDFRSLEQLTGAKLALQLLLYSPLVVAARRLAPAVGARACAVLGWGMMALALLLLVEAIDRAGLYQALRRLGGHPSPRPDWAVRDVARGAYVVALLFWPATLAIGPRAGRGVATVAFLIALVASVGLHVDSPRFALLASAAVFFGVRRFGPPAVLAVAVALVTFTALAPALLELAGPHLPVTALPTWLGKQSWLERLGFWRFVDGLILQKPWTGWGLDASRAFPHLIPLHPHDAALQVWLELGAPGAAAFALVWALVFRGIARLHARDPDLAAAAAGCAVAYFMIGAVSFGIWQEWWLALGALAAATIGWLRASRPEGASARNAGAGGLTPLGLA